MLCYIRLYVEVSSLENARKALDSIVEVTSKSGVSMNAKCSDYWKIKEYKRIEFELEVSPGFSLQQIGDLLGSGWILITPKELVWEFDALKTFCIESVRWAHIEVLEVSM